MCLYFSCNGTHSLRHPQWEPERVGAAGSQRGQNKWQCQCTIGLAVAGHQARRRVVWGRWAEAFFI